MIVRNTTVACIVYRVSKGDFSWPPEFLKAIYMKITYELEVHFRMKPDKYTVRKIAAQATEIY